jgi:hypothetical protein
VSLSEELAKCETRYGKFGKSSEAYQACVDRAHSAADKDTSGDSEVASVDPFPWASAPTNQYGVAIPKPGNPYDRVTGSVSTEAQINTNYTDPNSWFNTYSVASESDVPAYDTLPVNEKRLFEAAAALNHPQSTGKSMYEAYTKASYDYSAMGITRSPQAIAWEYVNGGAAASGRGSGGSGGSGGSAGPTKSMTRMTEPDIREMADNMAMNFIGRTLDDKEFNKIVKGQRKAENKNPTVSRVQGDTRVTEGGLTQQGREDLIEKRLMKSPEYRDFQFSTTAMDAVLGVIQEDMKISGQ